MFDQSGIYTLYGSKPMIRFPIFYYSDEEYQQMYESLSEKEKQTTIVLNDYDLPENWENWERSQAQFLSKRYILIKQPIPDSPKESMICFADLAKVALCLEKHYNLFVRTLHQEFDPLQEALSLKNGSPFWDQVFDNALLVGILYGFGEDNSFCFTWNIEKSLILHRQFSDHLRFGTTIDNFGIPIFATFSTLEDPMIEKYKKERAEIQKLYKGKDFVEVTLKQLFSN